MTRNVNARVPVNANIHSPSVADLDAPQPGSFGSVPAAVAAFVSVEEKGDPSGIVHQTILTLTALPITVRDTQQGGGAKIYTFPKGRILRRGACGTITPTTTSILANTLNTGVTGNWGVGSVTQASATVTTTEQDFINVAAFVASATINVAGSATNGTSPAVLALLNGTSTAIAAFLNLAVAGATDIDADATLLVSGVIVLNWDNIGPY